jgi:hypothetical protein
MSVNRTRKNKEKTHYGFLVSWNEKRPSGSRVKGETNIGNNLASASGNHRKNADSLAQAEATGTVKKDIIQSLIRISLILILELVVYLAWNKFVIQ